MTLKCRILSFFIVSCMTPWGYAEDIKQTLELETRYFPEESVYSDVDSQISLEYSAELNYDVAEIAGQTVSLSADAFVRKDSEESNRSRADFDRLVLDYKIDGIYLSAGTDIIFWGVTESQHLVDIINQTDLSYNVDLEDKISQPMLQATFENERFVLDTVVMFGHKERIFPDEGRLTSVFNISEDAVYLNSGRDKSIDFAARIYSYLDNSDIAVSYFNGTSREPDFVLRPTGSTSGTIDDLELVPVYDNLQQLGLEHQYFVGDAVFKTEAVLREPESADSNHAITSGVEYTLFNPGALNGDVGLVAEYSYDSRGEDAPALNLEHDVTTALRFTMHDHLSSRHLIGATWDHHYDDVVLFLESTLTLPYDLKLDIEARVFSGGDAPESTGLIDNLEQLSNSKNKFYSVQDDDYLSIRLGYYF